MAFNGTDIPTISECSEFDLDCPVEWSIYGYYPSLGGNIFFAVVFGACTFPQLYFGIRYKTWTYMLAMVLACVDQALGYAGRVMLHYDPFSEIGFQIQICCLILGPAFNAAAIYLVLKHITLCFGPKYSKIPPRWYTYIFIAGDLVSLVLQAIGGGIAATADDDLDRLELGDRLMMVGIAFQVFVLLVFGVAASLYVWNRRRASEPLSYEAASMIRSVWFRAFVLGFIAAYVAIMVRCIYRIAEMAGGWRNEIMQNEIAFIVLDGCMVAIATIIQTVLHPGYCFPRLSSGYVPVQEPSHPETQESMQLGHTSNMSSQSRLAK